MGWKTVEYSKNQIIKAGKTIRASEPNSNASIEALKIIDNWRASHAYPLHVIYCYFRDKNSEYVVAQRLKRLDSIVKKLDRESTMSLWTMQDLGGCRVIVPTVNEVFSVAQKYKASRVRHILKQEYDYINYPKVSGYRSLHLVYQYQSDTKETYNRNMLVEVQIRTYLQHLWATTVETMGLFTNQALKASIGEEETLYFFALISSLFAMKEGTPLVPNIPENVEDLINEIVVLNKKNKYLNMLGAIRVVVDRMDEKAVTKNGYYILILDYEKKHLRFKAYKPSQIDEATNEYNLIERTKKDSKIDAVLVSVSSFSALKIAYPNYFYDIKKFIDTVKELLEEQISKISGAKAIKNTKKL